jgi:hypothetical protein
MEFEELYASHGSLTIRSLNTRTSVPEAGRRTEFSQNKSRKAVIGSIRVARSAGT